MRQNVHLLFLFVGVFGLVVWPPSAGIIAPLWIVMAEYKKKDEVYEDK